ncbi:unnamed protein product [Cuscuta epithymum]|uniref:Lachrymatory factor synthase n=1 Tax=Cuscuta epithymum TaxID=186058 RepID=A0AAV0G311_9ASTE|nr:unnamed protein product [Cuscuta epithymum]
MAGSKELNWEGKTTASLNGPKAHKVWSVLVEDFSDIHKWLPNLDQSHHVEGVKGEVGWVRYVASTASSGNENKVRWCRERLVSIDHDGKCMSYQVLENNIGIKSYIATLKVLPTLDGDDEVGCEIVWSYVADPIDGMTSDAFFGFISSSLKGMAATLEKALQSTLID